MVLSLNEMALILIALLIGLVIGMMVSGRGKYRRLWREEQLARQQAVRDRETFMERQPSSIRPSETTGVETPTVPPRR